MRYEMPDFIVQVLNISDSTHLQRERRGLRHFHFLVCALLSELTWKQRKSRKVSHRKELKRG